MKTNTFNKIVDEQCKQIKSVLVRKGGEYATQDDRLHNFRVAARKLGISSEFALLGMDIKHVVSIEDMCRGLPASLPQEKISGYIDEKIGDHINYMILLKAILYERYSIC